MNQITIKNGCKFYSDRGYVSTGGTFVLYERTHKLVTPCKACEGKGTKLEWIDLNEFVRVLREAVAKQQHA